MPPKKKFTKEQIIDAAFEIAKLEGMDQITIRKVADVLGSSIAPIYVNFKDIDELITEVIKRIAVLSKQMLEQQNSGSPFLDVGLASLQFAKQYSVLFKDFMLNKNNHVQSYDQEMGNLLIEEMKKDAELEGLSEEDLSVILLKMKIFQLGLSIMVANEMLPDGFTQERQIQLLAQSATDVIMATRLRNNENTE